MKLIPGKDFGRAATWEKTKANQSNNTMGEISSQDWERCFCTTSLNKWGANNINNHSVIGDFDREHMNNNQTAESIPHCFPFFFGFKSHDGFLPIKSGAVVTTAQQDETGRLHTG
jgi:hypothetical protein